MSNFFIILHNVFRKQFFLLLLFPCVLYAQQFSIVPAEHSNIHFYNRFSHFRTTVEGNGVGVGDFDNDGWQDIFFVGDSAFALYRNKQNLQFENVIAQSGIVSEKGASSVTVYDVNNDGRDDIVIGFQPKFRNLEKERLHIKIYLNEGSFKFKEINHQWNINSSGNISRINLIDINKDGYIDFIINHWNAEDAAGSGTLLNTGNILSNGEGYISDKLFLNKKFTFTDVTREYGLILKTPTHTSFNSFSTDVNHDGWTDIIISNDFDGPDYLFLNDKGKMLKESCDRFFKVTSFSSMGSDVADINNDGLLDYFECDMRPIGNYRKKTLMFESPYTWYEMSKGNNKYLDRQYVRNTLQLNNGYPYTNFSEIGQYAGIDATDWSWGPLIADFDNDGWKDIFITNGMKFAPFLEYDAAINIDSLREKYGKNFVADYLDNDTVVPVHFKNFIYKNNTNLTFTNMQDEWGFTLPLDSRGAAYADLDNDGDLDIVVNNLNHKSVIYRNNQNQLSPKNFLRIKLINEENKPTLNSKVTIYHNYQLQIAELNPIRGFYSTSENILHFGLGDVQKIDSLKAVWPDGKTEILKNVAVNNVLTLYHKNAKLPATSRPTVAKPLFSPLQTIKWKHQENDFTDFEINPLLPNQYSKLGGAIACGDLNGDGNYDFVCGGAMGQPTNIFFQKQDASFFSKNLFVSDSIFEDMGILIFDVDGDGDNDIYIASGGYEYSDGDEKLLHRLYINDGKGNFSRSNNLSQIKTSASTVTACDFDKDGDMDLFVGGRVKSHHYPEFPESYLLQNENGKLIDVTDEVAPGLKQIGMVTASLWTDFNDDGWFDLIVVGEYMHPEFFRNNGKGKLMRITDEMNFGQKMSGFWNSITGADIDNDGDTDYILGNLGLNTRWKPTQTDPLELLASDFDMNGSLDIITTYRENGKSYPVKQLVRYKERISGLSKKYYKAAFFADATVFDIFPKDRYKSAIHLRVYESASGILINKGNNNFEFKILPAEAQFSPVFGIYAEDFDGDDNIDILLIGNFHGVEVERGKYTALNGLLLTGNGKGNFSVNHEAKNQFVVPGDAKALALLPDAKGNILALASHNNDSLKVFQFNYDKSSQEISFFPKDKNTTLIKLSGGNVRKIEKYSGSGYLSQSAPFFLKNTSVSVQFR
jgi:enediyne biosynthesis protein E4